MNLPGIEFFATVFEPAYCKWLLEDARRALREGREFARSNFEWDRNIVRASAPVLVRDFHPMAARFILSDLNANGIIEGYGYDVMNYAWCPLSYIPWHNDGHVDCAATVFLNEHWDPNWGGLFLYRESEETQIKAFAPSFNSGFRNDGHIRHATSMVAMDAPEPRFTLQIFAKPPKAGSSATEDGWTRPSQASPVSPPAPL